MWRWFLVKRRLDMASLVLITCVGLHVPRSFWLLYGFAALVAWRTSCHRGWLSEPADQRISYGLLQLAGFLIALFSLSYVVAMWLWHFWSWPGDVKDSANALFLPALMYFSGLRAAGLPRIWSSRLLVMYGLGGLVFTLAALAVSREPWWDTSISFYPAIDIAWGGHISLNVRSVEQNAYPALLMVAPALLLWLQKPCRYSRWLAAFMMFSSILGAHSLLSLQGRLGWLALLLSLAPLIILAARWWIVHYRLSLYVLLVTAGIACTSLVYGLTSSHHLSEIWGDGFCDERLAVFGAVLERLLDAPFGGRLLTFFFQICGNGGFRLLSPTGSSSGGHINLVHNVFLDVFYTTGLLPALLLLAAVIMVVVPLLRSAYMSFRSCGWQAPASWDWQWTLRWGWLCLLACQWMFQPLLYSDGLLFYFSFFVMGLFASEASRSLRSGMAESSLYRLLD